MKKNLLLLFMVALSFTSCMVSAESIMPSKNYATKKVNVNQFNGISTATSIDVLYTQTSGRQDVEIFAPDNLIEFVQVKVDDGILKVKFYDPEHPNSGINILGKHNTEVRISAPAIHVLQASSSGDVILKNGLKVNGLVTMNSSSSGDIVGNDVACDELVVKASSSGDVVLNQVKCTLLEADASSSGDVEIKNLKAERVNGEASSSGDVILAGECHLAKFLVSSSGDVEARNLKADAVTAKASSSGDVFCFPIESLEATTSSAGSVNYKGEPKHIDYHPKKGLNKID